MSGPRTEQTILAIRAMIDRGEVELGGRLIPEREMSERFGVSRSTVREALDEMRERGEIETRRGRGGGTFALPAGPRWEHFDRMSVLSGTHRLVEHRAGTPQSIATALAQQGFAAKTKLVAAGRELCPTAITSSFGYEEPREMLVVERIRIADEAPISFERAYLDPALFPDFLEHDFTPSIYATIQNGYDIAVARVDERIEVVPAKMRCAAYLGVVDGEPLLCVKSWAVGVENQLLQYSRDLFRADRVALLVSNEYPNTGEP